MEQIDMLTDMLSIGTVVKMTGVPKQTWLHGCATGRFPVPVRVSDRNYAWRRSDVEEVIKRLKDNGNLRGG